MKSYVSMYNHSHKPKQSTNNHDQRLPLLPLALLPVLLRALPIGEPENTGDPGYLLFDFNLLHHVSWGTNYSIMFLITYYPHPPKNTHTHTQTVRLSIPCLTEWHSLSTDPATCNIYDADSYLHDLPLPVYKSVRRRNHYPLFIYSAS